MKIPPKGSLYLESADNQAGIRHKNSTKSVIYLLSSEKHIIFALQKLSNSATIFAVRYLRLWLLRENYLDYLEDAYLFMGAKRFDVKGKRYFENTQKYYSMDLGLRNAKLNFRQQEKSHLMENMIYLELVHRGYSVDVGVVEVTRVKDGKKQQSQYEIDFVVNTGQEKIYIQSALNVDTEEKQDQETFSLKNSGDLFRKIVIVDGNTKQWTDENGIVYIGVIPFLLGESSLGF